MDGGSSGSPGLGGGGGPFVDLPAIIWSAVEASIMASMQGVAAIITAAVEECLADDDRGQGLSPIMGLRLRHIYGVAGYKGVPSI